MFPLAPLPVIVPLSAAVLLAGTNKFMPRRLADALAILATIASGLISADLMVRSRWQPIVYWFGGWTPRAGVALGISFAIDPFGGGLATFVALLVLAAFIFSLHYFDSIGTLFHVLMLMFLTAMCGFCLTGDLFNLFVWFELMSASAFALCGYKNEETQSMQGALNFAVTNTIGAFLGLSGIALLYGRTGALNMAQIGRSLAAGHADGLVLVAFVFIMVGFFIKAAIFPFHFWLADAHAVAPTPVCVLFSGVMVELGLYAVARVYWALIDLPFSSHRPALTGLLLVVGAITAVLAGIMCFGQRHIKRLLAFSTVSHMGLMLIGFALLRPDALAGTAMYVVGHGLSKGALFILSGILLHRFGSVDELELHDAAHGMKGTAIVWFIAGLGLAGLPMFATFLGEHSIEDTAEKAGQSWVWIIFLISAMLTAGAVFRVCGRVFFGWGRGEEAETGGAKKIDEGRETKPDHRVPAVMIGPAIALVGLALAVGLIPRVPQMFRLSAFEFADAAGYQARVLDHAAIPVQEPEEEHTSKMPSVARACGATAGALLLAAFALSPLWPRKKAYARPVRGAVWALRCMHSGHVGDYVAFLTFGVAAFGAVLAYFIH